MERLLATSQVEPGRWPERGWGWGWGEATSSGVVSLLSCVNFPPPQLRERCVCVFLCMQSEAWGGLGELRDPVRFGEPQAIWGHL